MTSADRDRIETFIYKYWVTLEGWHYDDVLAMLTEDVQYIALATSNGRAEVAASLKKRGTSSVVRHLITNMIIARTEETFEISYLLTAFGKIVAEATSFPIHRPFPRT